MPVQLMRRLNWDCRLCRRARASLRETARGLRVEDVSSVIIGAAHHEIVTERGLTSAISEGRSLVETIETIEKRTPVWPTTTSQ